MYKLHKYKCIHAVHAYIHINLSCIIIIIRTELEIRK